MFKSALKKIILKTGYQVTKIQGNKPKTNAAEKVSYRYQVDGLEFDFIASNGTYAPWFEDEKFLKIYSEIKEHTLVDMYRCFELSELVENIHRLDDKAAIIEIGVWRGGTAAIISNKLKALNAKNTFFIADTFTGVVKASEKDNQYKGGEHADTSLEIVENLLADKYDHLETLIGIFPDETAGLIRHKEKFGLCHIDVDVYKSAKDIVDWIWDKLIIGGIIIFDDYGFSSCTGIIKYVNEQKSLKDRIILYNLNGHAIMIKVQ